MSGRFDSLSDRYDDRMNVYLSTKKAMKEYTEKYTEKINRKRQPLRFFKPGDKVYMFLETNYNRKFGESKVRGPYEIIERIGRKAYRLKSLKYPEHKHPKSTVNIDRLVPYFERPAAPTVEETISRQLDESGYSVLYLPAHTNDVKSFAIQTPQYLTTLSGGNDTPVALSPKNPGSNPSQSAKLRPDLRRDGARIKTAIC